MGVLSNIDPTAVTVWVATIVLFALIALLRAVFKLNFSVLTIGCSAAAGMRATMRASRTTTAPRASMYANIRLATMC